MTDLPLIIDSTTAVEMLFGGRKRKYYYRLYEMIEREEIAAKKIGDRWFIPGKEMQRFIDEQE